eukprot:c51050_g1_i1 orf=3-194(-)
MRIIQFAFLTTLTILKFQELQCDYYVIWLIKLHGVSIEGMAFLESSLLRVLQSFLVNCNAIMF